MSVRAIGVLLVALAVPSAQAAAVSVSTPFFNLEFRGPNSLGWATGEFVRFGAGSVTPTVSNAVPHDLSQGTVGWVTKDGVDPNAWVQRIWWDGFPVAPNFAQRFFGDSSFFRGNFTLHFRNDMGGSSHQVDVPVTLNANATHAPKIENLTLSGTGALPTFSWSPPPGTLVNGYRVNVYDRNLALQGVGSNIMSRNLQPDVTSFTVQPQDFTAQGHGFEFGKNYVIEISIIQTKDGQSTNLSNANLQAIGRSYADFTRLEDGGPAVNLPVLQADGSYLFNMAVQAGQTYFIDPEVAVGYDYAIGQGNPKFASVVLPTGIGDGLYDLWGFDASNTLVLLADDLAGGQVFTFAGDGVDRFRVTGIETSAGLDPDSTTAFVTGLSFAGAGAFTGTQTPITVTVPEAPTLALLLAAAGVAGLRRRALRAKPAR